MTEHDPNEAQDLPSPDEQPISNPAEEALAAAEQALRQVADAGEKPAHSPEDEAMLAAFRAAIDESQSAAASSSGAKAVGQGSTYGASLSDAAPYVAPAVQPAGPARVPEELGFLSDVNLNVKIELGRTRMYVEDVLRLGPGAVVELDKLAGDPVDVYVNDRHVARGEVLVLNDNFCVRISEILSLTE
ncbi:MAG: flagellar motor switch protein FliN [Phycisphaerales bacterium]|nr:flagellar motor switch protein FliN [Phycisphaerales bacterium]